MASLEFRAESGEWYGLTTLNYTVAYDPATNTSTVTFKESEHFYFSQSGKSTNATTKITVTPTDNTSGKESTTFKTTGSGAQFYKAYSGTPSPKTVVVHHDNSVGEKKVKISATTTYYANLWNTGGSMVYVEGSGSKTHTAGTFTGYTLSTSIGEGSTLTIVRKSSSIGATGIISNGATVYYGDVLVVTYSGSATHTVTTRTINGKTFTSGAEYTVTGSVLIVTETKDIFKLAITAGSGATVKVVRKSSQVGAAGELANGSDIYAGDILSITFSGSNAYKVISSIVNEMPIVSGAEYGVSGNVEIVIETQAISTTFIFHNGAWRRYLIHIYHNGRWRLYRLNDVFLKDMGRGSRIVGNTLYLSDEIIEGDTIYTDQVIENGTVYL